MSFKQKMNHQPGKRKSTIKKTAKLLREMYLEQVISIE